MLALDSTMYNLFLLIESIRVVGIYKEDINLLKKEWCVFLGISNTISTRTGITFKKLHNLNLTIHE